MFDSVMTMTHTEPVFNWGLELCESSMLSTTALVSGHGDRGAPRPAGLGRGIFEVQTSLNCFLQFYGGRHSVGRIEGNYYETEEKSSPATAPPAPRNSSLFIQGSGCARTVGKLICTFVVFRSRMSGDLENSLGGHHV